MRGARLLAALGLSLVLGLGTEAAAQGTRPSLLVLNQERILTGSQRGQALLAAENDAREALRTTAREIEAAFEAEESRLTEQRASLDPAEFRALADDFDQRVNAAREEQDARAASLAQEFDQRRRQFYAEVGPVLVRVMERMGALVILDENSVLLSDQALNITDEVIAEIDGTAPAQPPVQPEAPSRPEEPQGVGPALAPLLAPEPRPVPGTE